MPRITRLTPAVAAIGLAETIRWSRWRAPLTLRAEAQAPPAALAALIRAVEREPELVPGVQRVTILAREEPALPGSGGFEPACYGSLPSWLDPSPEPLSSDSPSVDGRVRYEVQGMVLGLPWAVRFCKVWENDTRFVWWSEGGTGRPDHCGCLRLQPHDAGTRMELRAATRSALPLLGGAATLLVNPLFLAPTFTGWLRNLARAAQQE